ncbi:plasmid pRiA4b ORF-3 family protein [Actinoplanes subtropicus]|uniref:plasmid pRiA4b ORF-3 family protein n=1 Tax=Actinoplanes subtropicus TaxID=543632 RepID=UPI0004C2BEE9|nr:plasmid pRiA4b ORF-3 family protein [Actinoplanes subtropicus]
MSPRSRGRKGGKSRRSGPRILRALPPVESGACDCPACTGEDLDPQQLIDDLVAGGAELLEAEDPLEAELFGAAFLAAGGVAGDGFADALAEGIVPAVAAQADQRSLAVLLALGAVADGSAAADAATMLAGAGVPAPAWASELAEPVRVALCRRFSIADGTASALLCTFDRGSSSHGFLLHADHTDCHAAVDIVIFPGEVLGEVLDTLQKDARRADLKMTAEDLEPAEFRWQTERALDARAVHDADLGPDALADDDDADGLGYHQLAALLRARMRTLPEPPRPPAPHDEGSSPLDMLTMFRQLAAAPGTPRQRRAGTPKLPAKRKKSSGTAPIYQIKVALKETKPPIWRRLEVPADTSLAKLHGIIQTAFGWEDAHLHVFETAYGDFGVADRELGHRAEAPVTLEQVAPAEGDKFGYTYDFGDNWTHEITVEKALDRGPGPYPRCTGGRRAAPPEDCGGVWGYADLLEILADPAHPEHEERLEWLGLDSSADFDPARFNAADITRALTK